jgi:arabinose-5-phosphate isomerase
MFHLRPHASSDRSDEPSMNIQDRIAAVLAAEAAAIAAVRVTPEFERAVLALRDAPGKVLTTGMGKAGHVARKFASTLCSTGTPAVYMHPGEAAHGDLGLIGPDDCIVAFSTSGKTREVLEVLELGRHVGLRTVIGITSHPDSDLRRLSDVVLDMGIVTEPCPHGLTPSASTAVMLAIGDALALVLMELKGFSRHDFGLRHHGGYLGRAARVDNE